MAWAGTTTYIDPKVAKLNSGVTVSTNFGYSTVGLEAANGKFPGGVHLTTGTDVVRFPMNQPDGKLLIFVEYNGAVTTTAVYPQISLRIPESSDGRAWRAPYSGAIGTSTAESGWKLICTTGSVATATSEAITAIFGPFESAKYGHVFPDASSNGIDKNQLYIEAMFTLSTVGSTNTVMNSTTLQFTAANVIAFELP